MSQLTPRFCYRNEIADSQDESFSKDKTSLQSTKRSHKSHKNKRQNSNRRKSFFDRMYAKSSKKDYLRKNIIRLSIMKKFFDEEFDPEKDYEQFHYKRFLLSKIEAFNGQNLDNEELYE